MSIKRVMPVVIGTLMISILIVYVQFQKDIPEDKSAQDQTAVIKVLSCYEIMGQQEILRQFADEFNEQNPGLRVEMEFIDKENLKKDICLREERGDKADMVICDSLEMAGLLDMDVLEDITPYITKERRASVIWPDMWQAVMDDGKYYGIPFSCDPYVLFSNTGYFEKKALDVPDNWNQVFEVCNSIDSSGIYGLGFGVRRTGDGARLYSSVLYICGGSYYSLDSSPGIRSLELFDTLKRWGYVDKNVINYTQTDIWREFADEKAAMIIAPISVKTYLDQLKSGISYRITAVPGEVREGYVLSGDNIGILKNGDRGALAFMGYLYQPEVRTRFLNATGTLPLFQAEAGEGGNDRDMLQLKKGFVNQGILLKSYNSWFEVSSILSEYVCSLLTKKNIDVPETARNLQDEVRVAIMNH